MFEISDAILKGCEMSEPVEGNLFEYHKGSREVTHTCALGAAALGTVGLRGKQGASYFATLWATAKQLRGVTHADCPECHLWEADIPIGKVIEHINDQHHWPRERTAAWLRTMGL